MKLAHSITFGTALAALSFILPAFALPALAATKPHALSISSVGDTMAWDKTTLQVKAGEEVKLTIKNNSKSAALEHNWALVKPGTEDAVAQAGIAAGADKGWFANTPDVIAHGTLLKPGAKETITFTAPSTPGDYPYICTFPGHASMMKGVLKVK
jgi:azurin